jgi:hypothetical protein
MFDFRSIFHDCGLLGLSTWKASVAYKIPKATIYNRLRYRKAKSGPNPVLTTAEEATKKIKNLRLKTILCLIFMKIQFSPIFLIQFGNKDFILFTWQHSTWFFP